MIKTQKKKEEYILIYIGHLGEKVPVTEQAWTQIFSHGTISLFEHHQCNLATSVSDKAKAVAHLCQVGAEMEESPSIPLHRPGVFGQIKVWHCQEALLGRFFFPEVQLLSHERVICIRCSWHYTHRWQLKLKALAAERDIRTARL